MVMFWNQDAALAVIAGDRRTAAGQAQHRWITVARPVAAALGDHEVKAVAPQNRRLLRADCHELHGAGQRWIELSSERSRSSQSRRTRSMPSRLSVWTCLPCTSKSNPETMRVYGSLPPAAALRSDWADVVSEVLKRTPPVAVPTSTPRAGATQPLARLALVTGGLLEHREALLRAHAAIGDARQDLAPS